MRFFLIPLLALLLAQPARAAFSYLDDEAETGGYDVSAQITSFPANVALARAENGDGYTLRLSATDARLEIKRGGKTGVLARSILKPRKLPLSLVAQRRGPRWRVILGGQTALQAENDAFNEGQIGVEGGVKEARVQPIEPIKFDDDFMRVASEVALEDARKDPRKGVRIAGAELTESIWSALTGRWATTGLTENAEAQVAQSANPFAFRALETGGNLAVAGRAFWSDYRFAISVLPQGAQEIGIIANASDAKNYVGLFWSESGAPQLRAVVDGKARVLASSTALGGLNQKQWVRLEIAATGDTLRGFVDGTEVVRAQTGLFARGQVGVWAKLTRPGSDKGEGAAFDDAQVRSSNDFYDDFGRVVPGRWTTIAGSWTWQNSAKPADARGAFAAMGEGDWADYRVTGDLTIPINGAAGLLLHHRAGEGAYLLRVGGAKSPVAAGRVQIARLEKGKTVVLSEARAPKSGATARWEFGSERGYLSARLNGVRVLDAFDLKLAQGRAGVYAQNGGSIRAFATEFPTRRAAWAKVPELYEVAQQAQTMGNWSTPEGFWVARTAGTAPVWEHKGRFFGDGELRFALPDLSGAKEARVSWGKQAALKFSSSTITLEGAKPLVVNHALKAGERVEVARRGSFVIVRAGEKVLLTAKI